MIKFWRNLVEMILAATVHTGHVLMKNTTCKFKQWHNTWCLMFTRHWKRCSNKVLCSINEDNSKLACLKSASIFHLVWWIWNCCVLYTASYSLVNCDSHVSAAAWWQPEPAQQRPGPPERGFQRPHQPDWRQRRWRAHLAPPRRQCLERHSLRRWWPWLETAVSGWLWESPSPSGTGGWSAPL